MRLIGRVALGMALVAGCVQPPELPELAPFADGAGIVDALAACLTVAPVDMPFGGPLDGERGSSCTETLRADAPGDGEALGCFVAEADDGRRAVTPLVISADGIGFTQAVAMPNADIVRAALFVYREQEALDDCLAGRVSLDDACEAPCRFKLSSGVAQLVENDDGIERVFPFVAGGVCGAVWSGPAPADACDGIDNDCNGVIDDPFADRLGEPCAPGGGGGLGCGDIEWACDPSGADLLCARPDVGELCDRLDNDCDGTADEGLVGCCEPGEVTPCNQNLQPPCLEGTQTCGNDGSFGPCLDAGGNPVTQPIAEMCDEVDNDCNGLVDDGLTLGDAGPAVGEMCDDGQLGACRSSGVVGCEFGQVACVIAEQGGTPSPEGDDIGADGDPDGGDCNGIDDDCDGEVDESLNGGGPMARECWTGPLDRRQGACMPGRRECTDGEFGGGCLDEVLAQPPICQEAPEDRIDEDCDGIVEEGINLCGTCGVAPMELCDAEDNDCDGNTDEDFDVDSDPDNCGACGYDCADPPDGEARVGIFRCEAGECALTGCPGGFVDLDGELRNGCECRAGDEVVDYDDDDCDGVVDASRGGLTFFVAPSIGAGANRVGRSFIGRDGNVPVAPFNTLDQALQAIEQERAGQQPENWAPITLVLEVGEYDLPGGLDVPDRVSILGGYTYLQDGDDDGQVDEAPVGGSRDHQWLRERVGEGEATVLTGHPVMLRYSDLTGDVVLNNVRVDAIDARVEDHGTDNSAAVVALDVGDHLQIADCVLSAGAGDQGTDGRAGEVGAARGAVGSPGVDADAAISPGRGGAGGSTPVCAVGLDQIDDIEAARGGRGGDAAAEVGGDGQDGGRVADEQAPGFGGRGGRALQDGEHGTDGAIGPHGANSAPGGVDGRLAAGRTPIPWQAKGSQDAGGGLPGGGGGGGGAGGAGADGQPGGGGGGGGAGGCPGTGGSQASGGGGSFALVVRDGRVGLVETRLQSSSGGAGGSGGRGGNGRSGGDGLPGGAGANCSGCGPGGDGGDGGDGGCGGNAGGGAGGPSLAVLRLAAAVGGLDASDIIFLQRVDGQQLADQIAAAERFLTPGIGGGAGDGGDAGGDCGEPAADGPRGHSVAIGCCRAGAGGCSANPERPLACD